MCVPAPSGNGRGIAFDPVDGDLWSSFVSGATYAGDGLIHKTTLPPGCASVGSIPFGDGPAIGDQNDIGAIDIDPDDADLWIAGYKPIVGNSFLYKVNRTTGAILESCSVPFVGTGGNDTLAVAKIPGLTGSGKYLLTDAGENLKNLMAVDAATCSGGSPAIVVTTFAIPLTFGMTGIDYEQGRLIATDSYNIYNLGGPPFSAVLATMSSGVGSVLEDITLRTGLADDCTGLTPTSGWTSGNDVIVGGPGDDVFFGGPGDDVILGGGGNDVICGGPGNDVLLGGDGNDRLVGGAGDDVLLGENGNDTSFGGVGNDVLVDQRGIDLLSGGSGLDNLNARDGFGGDQLFGGPPLGDNCLSDAIDPPTTGCP